MEHGEVTSVEYRDGVAYCAVRPMRESSPYDPMPVMKAHSGIIQVPKVGETVAMQKLDDGTRFISDVLGKVAERPAEMSEGDVAIQLDGGTKLEFLKRGDGKYDINIEASGNITIDGIDFDEHTHEYSWTDSGGSGTTDSPK